MLNKISSRHTAGILIFIFGVVCASTLTAALTWANLEAAFYGFQRTGSDDRLSGLACPALMTPYETGTIRISFANPTQQELTPVIRIDLSTPAVPDSSQEQINIQAGQTGLVTRPVSAANIDLGFFIFAKASSYSTSPLPTAEATCGTLILNVSFLNGAQIFGLWLGVGLLLMPLGLWLWSTDAALADHRSENAAKALALVALVGLFAGIQGQWLFGMLLLAVSVLLAAAILRFVIPN